MTIVTEPGQARSHGLSYPGAARHRHPSGAGGAATRVARVPRRRRQAHRAVHEPRVPRPRGRAAVEARLADGVSRGGPARGRRHGRVHDREPVGAGRAVGAGHDQGVRQLVPAPRPPHPRRRRSGVRASLPVPRLLLEPRRLVEADPGGVGLPARRPRRVPPPRAARRQPGGFVFVNFDPELPPVRGAHRRPRRALRTVAARQRFKHGGARREDLRCNWKVAQEAFMEAFHVGDTPAAARGHRRRDSQYDVFGTFSRAITPNGTPSPHLSWAPTEQEMFDAMTDRRLDEPPAFELAEGMTARQAAAASAGCRWRPSSAPRRPRSCPTRLVDSFYYTLFPNFHPWGVQPHRVPVPAERRRPRGIDHGVHVPLAVLRRAAAAAPIHWLGADDSWTDAALGFLARVFNQDALTCRVCSAG